MACAADFRISQVTTALQCLMGVASRHGIELSADGICHKYALGPDPISETRLLRIAKDAGLRARIARLDWDALLNLGEAYPALVRLTNGNWVIVAGAASDG